MHNDSTKGYGSEGTLRRACATKLSDPQQFFNLTHATEDKPDETIDDIDEAEPQSEITIDQEFSVNDLVLEFSDGWLTLELLLADPQTGQMRSVQKYHMRMQISANYELSPDPSVLLVVNPSTPNHAIHQIIGLLRHRLHTKLDIFNLGLTGSYESPVTKRNVLESYAGRTVVVFANAFTYFGREAKNPWDLLSAWETALLLKAGTSLLFANVAEPNLHSLQDWAGHAHFPVFDHDPTADLDPVGSDPNAKGVAVALRQLGPDAAATSEVGLRRYPVPKGCLGGLFGSTESTLNKSATKAAKALNKEMPLRRFATFPEAGIGAGADNTIGTVVVCEGVPRTARLIATMGYFGPSPAGTNAIADYDMYFIVSCLPFALRTRMFWNMVGRTREGAGVACSVLYGGAEGFLQLPDGTSAEESFVDEKVWNAALPGSRGKGIC